MTTIPVPLRPDFCNHPDPAGVLPATCLPTEDTAPVGTLADAVGNDHGHLLGGGGALDTAFGYLSDVPSSPPGALDAVQAAHMIGAPWYSTVSPGAAVALVTITGLILLVSALIGYGVHVARSAR